MKIKSIFAAAIAATLIFASCAKEDKVKNNDGAATKPMTLVIKNNGLNGTRGVDNKIADKSVTLETGWVLFLINGVVDDKLEIGASGDVTAAELALGYTIDEVRNTVDQVVVLANLGSKHSAVGTATDLSTITWLLTDIQATGDLSDIALWGQGECVETASVMTADVEVAPMASRIQIPGIQLSSNFTYELAGVFINNIYTSFDGMGDVYTRINNGTLISNYDPATYTPSGMADGSSTIKYYAADNAHFPYDGTEYKSFWAYNVFPADGGSSKIPHIIFHLKNVRVAATFTTTGGETFPENHVVNGDGNVYLTIGGYTGVDEFEAGYIYTITTTSGDEDDFDTDGTDPSDPGIIVPDDVVVDDDNTEPEKGNYLTGHVTVTVQQWTPEALNPEW